MHFVARSFCALIIGNIIPCLDHIGIISHFRSFCIVIDCCRVGEKVIQHFASHLSISNPGLNSFGSTAVQRLDSLQTGVSLRIPIRLLPVS